MRDSIVTLYDMGLQVHHPPVLLDTRKYVRLVERLCDLFPSARRESDGYEFSLSAAQAARITPQMVSVRDLFEEDTKATKRRVFQVLGRILEIMEVERIETFDHMVSARLQPPGTRLPDGFGEYPGDLFIGKSFLKNVDFGVLGARGDRPLAGVSWVFDLEEKAVSLRFEPFQDNRDLVFIELSVQHPEGNFSLGDLRAAVESDLRYLKENVVRFLMDALEAGTR